MCTALWMEMMGEWRFGRPVVAVGVLMALSWVGASTDHAVILPQHGQRFAGGEAATRVGTRRTFIRPTVLYTRGTEGERVEGGRSAGVSFAFTGSPDADHCRPISLQTRSRSRRSFANEH